METSNSKSISDVVERIYSWIPRKAESRKFWMPDRSCHVCYSCDSHFSLFNRRHHCRLCGKVFCGRCSFNTISTNVEEGRSYEEGERVRVCRYCYDQQNSLPTIQPTPTLTPSSSAQSIPNITSEPSVCVAPASPKQPVGGGITIPKHRHLSVWDEVEDECLDLFPVNNSSSGSRGSSCSSLGAMDTLSPENPDIIRSDDDEDNDKRPKEDMSSEHQDDDEDESGTPDQSSTEMVSDSRRYSSQSSMSHNPGYSDDKGNLEGELAEKYVNSAPAPVKPVDYESIPSIWEPPAPSDEQDDDEEEDDDDDYDSEIPLSDGIVGSLDGKKDKAASSEQRKVMQEQVARHFGNLVAQLLQQKGIDGGESGTPDSWQDIVTSVSWFAATLIKPDTSNGGDMDPAAYVKVKCVACGKPSDSAVVKGIVFKKNVAHKRMTTRYNNPRLLLLGGALEYQRVSNQLSSIDTLMKQETDHLSMTVSRIEAHQPNVLLVEKSVSRSAQEELLKKDISLVLNVKRSLLERIARCVGGQVVPSPDTLVSPTAVQCELFHVERFVEEHGSAGQDDKKLTKHLMFFEGVPKPLGCTILLKGENGDFLKRVKKVVQLAVFSAYHLQLETSFLEDEGATLPTMTCKSTTTTPILDMHSRSARSTSSSGPAVIAVSRPSELSRSGQSFNSNYATSSVPSMFNSTGSSAALSSVENTSTVANGVPISASSSVSSATNSPGSNPAESSVGYEAGVSRTSSIGGTMTTTYHQKSNGVYPGGQAWQGFSGLSISLKRNPCDAQSDSDSLAEVESMNDDNESLSFEVKALEVNTVTGPLSSATPDQVITTTANMTSKGTIRERGEDYHILPDEVQANLSVLIQNSLESDIQSSKDDYPPSPSDRPSILVQLVRRCPKRRLIKGPQESEFLRIFHYKNADKYYGNAEKNNRNADKPLGMFLRDTLFDTSRPCKECDGGEAHDHCFIHKQGSLTITVKNIGKPLPGEKYGRIWMWHRCLKCPPVDGLPPCTSRVIMSDAAWGLSFGKFLELSFSTHPAASRLAACGHSLHRDCLRFYGFGAMVACFRYSQITIFSVYLPPLSLEFNSPAHLEWLQKEIEEVQKETERVFSNILNTLRGLAVNNSNAQSAYGNRRRVEAKQRIVALEALLARHKDDFEKKVAGVASASHEPGKPPVDILVLNYFRRELCIRSVEWEWNLTLLEKNFPPNKMLDSGTGSVDVASMLAKTPNGKTGLQNLPDSVDVDNESFSEGANSGDVKPGPDNLVGSPQAEQTAGGEPSPVLPQFGELEDAAVTSVNGTQTEVITDLSNGKVLQHLHLPLSPSAGELDNLDSTPKRGHTPGSKSIELGLNESIHALASASYGEPDECPENGETNSSESDFSGSKPVARRHLESEITARRAFSEGNFPLLADLSTTLDAAWTGDGRKEDGSGQSSVAENSLITPKGISESLRGGVHTTEELVQGSPALEGQVTSDGAQDGDGNKNENGHPPSSDLQSSGPTLPRKSDSVEDLTEWRMDAPPHSRAAQRLWEGGPRILPQGRDDVVVAVYDDEPTTIIAYALSTEEHYVHVTDILVEKERSKDRDQDKEPDKDLKLEVAMSHPLQVVEPAVEAENAAKDSLISSNNSSMPRAAEMENPLNPKNSKTLQPAETENPLNPKNPKTFQTVKKTISFTDDTPQGAVKFQVTCYFAKQFEALRKKCCMGNQDYIRSLCRCKKWGAQGGKSNVFFAKTADERFIVKQVTRTELSSFFDFALSYFKYLSEAITEGHATCLAKIFGVYEVKTVRGGKETKMDVLVMENLLYGRNVSLVYDLKGSTRSRYNADTGKNQVLLDQNLLESMPTNPIYVGTTAKETLERAVWNDTSFLSLVSVMDYSLLVGVDEKRRELVVGIIDFIRQYTWDKHLETWVKASGFLGGPKNATPTVISPKQYKKRFRKEMRKYFLTVPDEWMPPPQLTVPDQWMRPPPLTDPRHIVSHFEENINLMKKGENASDENDVPRPIPSH